MQAYWSAQRMGLTISEAKLNTKDIEVISPYAGLIKVSRFSARFKYVEALGRIIIGGPYSPSNAIIYMHLQL